MDRPGTVLMMEASARIALARALLDRTGDALLGQVSQTRGLAEAVGLERCRAWVASQSVAGAQTT